MWHSVFCGRAPRNGALRCESTRRENCCGTELTGSIYRYRQSCMSDRVFSSDALRFAKNIYDTPKGRIRQAVLQADLAFLRNQNPDVLDMGAGLGQINQWLAQGGARVTH